MDVMRECEIEVVKHVIEATRAFGVTTTTVRQLEIC